MGETLLHVDQKQDLSHSIEARLSYAEVLRRGISGKILDPRSIFKNYEHGGSKRTTTGSNYDPPLEVSRPPSRDNLDCSSQHSRSTSEKRGNHGHSQSSPNRSLCDGFTHIPYSPPKKVTGQWLIPHRSCGERSTQEHTPAISNTPCDDDPQIPRFSGGEEDGEKRSLGLSITEHSNDVTSGQSL
ncbi:hypothetical protein Ancab_019375, partial [Ancistrocladus abbreviatus]